MVQKAYGWALWIMPKVEKFPKSYRFSIGQSLVTASIELFSPPWYSLSVRAKLRQR